MLFSRRHRLTFSYSRALNADPVAKPDIHLLSSSSTNDGGKSCPLCRNSVALLPIRSYGFSDALYANHWVNFTVFPANRTFVRHFVNKETGEKESMSLLGDCCPYGPPPTGLGFRPWNLESGDILGH
jgi:hypothetical protein